MIIERQIINQDNNSNNNNAVNVKLPDTDKEVPIKIGKFIAVKGYFLAKFIFEECKDAYEPARTEHELQHNPKKGTMTVYLTYTSEWHQSCQD